MSSMVLHPIGAIRCTDDGFYIELDKRFAPALEGLEGYSHIQVLWWFSHCDNAECRAALTNDKPYTHGPDTLGTFATRSPARPNPIAVSTAQILYVDPIAARVGLAYIDAFDGTPVLDVKPYTPSLDRVESPGTPSWCAHWPQSTEASGDFDWESEFNF